MITLLLIFTLLLAAANGANDISKGISTLFGSGISKYRTAVIWGTIWTVAGALVAAMASQQLVATFSGNGLLRDRVNGTAFLLAVAVGAIGWLVIATRSGLPVSTTHSLVGSLLGAALLARGMNGIAWPVVAKKVVVPLLLSPLIAILLVLVVLPLLARAFRQVNQYCLCIEQREPLVAVPNGVAAATQPSMEIVAGCGCDSAPATVMRLNAMDSLHWLSAGLTSFFRGMNDTPKILALALTAGAAIGLSALNLYVLIGGAMAAGSLIAGFRVTRTLAQRVTKVTAENGFAANVVTSTLVGLASLWSLPVSTTHISTGTIVGIGLTEEQRGVNWKMVGEILLAWVVTLPVSALLAASAFWLLR